MLLPHCRVFGSLRLLGFFAVCALPGAYVSATGLYVPPSSSPFITAAGETVTTLNISSGSISDAQTKINNARSANAGAVIVVNLSGTYPVSSAALVLPSKTCLVLAPGAVIKAASSSIAAPSLIQVSSQSDVSVAGGMLDGSGANVTAINVTTCDRVNIDFVVIRNCQQDGIKLTGHGNTTFDNEMAVTRCDISGCANGINVSSGTQFVGVDNNCHGNAGAGIMIGTGRGTLGTNTCSANTTGISVSGSDNAVTDNEIDGNATGIALTGGSTNNLCTSNHLVGNTTAGINSAGTGNTIFDNTFSGNASNLSSSGSGNNIIPRKGSLSASGQNYFYPPLVDDPHTAAIMNGKARTDITIGSATISSVQSQYNSARSAHPNDVIVLHLTGATYTGSSSLALSSNTCVLLSGTIKLASGIDGITASGQSDISVSGGTIDGGAFTNHSAVNMSGCTMVQFDGITLKNFGPANPRTGGAVLHYNGGSTPFMVTRSTVNGGSGRGIWTQSSTFKAIISENDLSNVNMDGFDGDSTTSASLVKFNNCHDNVRYGVFFEQRGSYNTAIGNTCMRNGRGINVYNNAVTPDTAFNTVICNLCDSNANALRSGSVSAVTSHNFFFNNQALNSTNDGIESDPTGTENYYSQTVLGGNGTAILTSGSEAFFNPPAPSGAPPSVVDPAFSPAGGTYSTAQTVTISSATSGAIIRYTTDGSTPGETAGTIYSGPVSVGSTTTLKAIAYESGFTDSAVASATYTITLSPAAAPVFSPAGGSYTSTQIVTISSATSGASLRYTTDGSAPTETHGTVYSSPVSVSTTTTLKAIAYKSGLADSAVTSATYTIGPPPTLNFEAESLSPVGTGATVSISNDANASGGVVEFLNSTAAGQIITFTTPSIPAGTYQVQLRYKTNTSRGQHTVKIDGTQVGGTIDQYATTQAYLTTTLGNVTFSTTGTHTIAMTVTGKRAAATQFYITADKFTFVGQ